MSQEERNGQPHDFQECLARSHKYADLPVWEEVYRKAFPGFATMVDHRKDGPWQRFGIDRSITLESSKQILVDEKARDKDYGDILLEYESNSETKALGWVVKPLLADYICYLIAPKGCAYLLPVLQLQSAWKYNGREWQRMFRRVVAKNRGYETYSCPVPVNVLFGAMGDQLRVGFQPFQLDNEGGAL